MPKLFYEKRHNFYNDKQKINKTLLHHHGKVHILHIFSPKVILTFRKWTKKMSKTEFPN